MVFSCLILLPVNQWTFWDDCWTSERNRKIGQIKETTKNMRSLYCVWHYVSHLKNYLKEQIIDTSSFLFLIISLSKSSNRSPSSKKKKLKKKNTKTWISFLKELFFSYICLLLPLCQISCLLISMHKIWRFRTKQKL